MSSEEPQPKVVMNQVVPVINRRLDQTSLGTKGPFVPMINRDGGSSARVKSFESEILPVLNVASLGVTVSLDVDGAEDLECSHRVPDVDASNCTN